MSNMLSLNESRNYDRSTSNLYSEVVRDTLDPDGHPQAYEGKETITTTEPQILNTSEHPQAFQGKEVVAPSGLEAAGQEGKEVYNNEEGGKHVYSSVLRPTNPKKQRRAFSIIGLVAFITVVAACVPVAVVVSMNKKHTSSHRTSSNGSSPASSDIPINATISPSPVTSKTSGNVLEGTRLVIMGPKTGGDIFLFYQWDDSSLRYIDQSPQRVWQGSTDLHVTDARLGTPLAAVATGANDSVIWWLYYVDNADVIQNIYSPKDPTIWHKGDISSHGYKVPNETNIAFTANHGRKFNASLNDIDGGMSLYASALDGMIHEYIFDDSDQSWSDAFTFPNTNGSSGASIWSTSSTAFLYTASSSQSLELWYRDYNATSINDPNRWQLGPSSSAELMQNGSMCGQYGFVFQGSSGAIQGSNFSTFAEPSDTRWDTTYDISDQPAINCLAVSCWYWFPQETVNPNIMFQVFYQTEGSKIEEAYRTWGPDNKTVPGTWTYTALPV